MISHLSSWKLQGTIIRVSPSRIQTRFFIFPLILPIRVTPSKQRTRIWFAPIIRSAEPNISLFHFLGSLTRTNGVPSGFTALGSNSLFPFLWLLSVIPTTPHILRRQESLTYPSGAIRYTLGGPFPGPDNPQKVP